MKNNNKIISIFVCFLILLSHLLYGQDRTSGKSFATRSEVLAQNGMVATNHPLATQIGLDMLKKGGSAVDAAIAANAFLGLADPAMNGIGGDLYAIVWDEKTKKLYGLNASGRSPESMTIEDLEAQLEAGKSYIHGPLSISTPGCVDGWFELHQKFGKLKMAELLEPAIQYAKAGVPVTQETADYFSRMEASIQKSNNTTFKRTYFLNGRFPRKGEVFKNPDLAHSLEIIAKEGRDGFYKGEIAQKIDTHMKENGGFLSVADLGKHRSEWLDPISVKYRGYEVWEMPPNGQGLAVLQMLTILEGFDIGSMGYGTAEHLHHLIEAKKLAYEDLAAYYGDPEWGAIPIEKLISKEYADSRRAMIDPGKAGMYHPGLSSGDHTIYLATADKEGNMVSLIQSNSGGFGSREVPEGLGFVLQNRGRGFILDKGHINVYAPGKRPFHTIIPAFITKDSQPFISFGVMGGDMQPQGHVQIITNLIDFGMNLQEAGDAPRVFHSGTFAFWGHIGGVGDLYLESGFPLESIQRLREKGHIIQPNNPMSYGGYQAIMRKNGVYYGASDPRKDGHAAGY